MLVNKARNFVQGETFYLAIRFARKTFPKNPDHIYKINKRGSSLPLLLRTAGDKGTANETGESAGMSAPPWPGFAPFLSEGPWACEPGGEDADLLAFFRLRCAGGSVQLRIQGLLPQLHYQPFQPRFLELPGLPSTTTFKKS